MIIGRQTLEWNDGTPYQGGMYLALTKDGDITNAFREIPHIPDGSGRLYRPACWKLDDPDCGWRECGEGYIRAWAEWPCGYEIKRLDKDKGE